MKHRWKRLLSVGSLLALLLVGCTNTGTTPPAGSESGTTGESSTQEPPQIFELALVENGASQYQIVYPEDADTTIVREARNLARELKNYTGAELTVTDDFLKKDATAPAYEILIGDTNRAETATVKADLLSTEYAVRAVGTKLVILGGSEHATTKASEYFVEKILKKTAGLSAGTTNGTLQFTSAQDYVKRSQYNIRSITLNGVSITSYQIVVPASSDVESYLAKLLKRHIALYSGMALDIVTDAEAAGEYEIRIGQTARTTATVTAGKATVAVGEKAVEVLWDTDFGMTAAYNILADQMFSNLNANIALKTGDTFSETVVVQANAAKTGEMRIMYHNVWGYINYDGSNPISIRPDVALTIYRAYQPDVLCLQECSSAYRDGGTALFEYLGAHYTEVCYSKDGGTGNPIFFRTDLFENVESGYAKSRSGDKGTTWVVLKRKSDQKLFGVTNSHFAADTNAGDDPILGNEYRVQDATTMANAAKAIVEKYGKISVFCGGDFNTNKTGDPYLALTEAGLTNIRTIANECTEFSPYYKTFSYVKDYDLYSLQSSLTTSAEWAIDHLMILGVKPNVARYDVVSYSLACTASDHAAHFADVTLAEQTEITEGDPSDMTHIGFEDLFVQKQS